jgi:hypothetical protein
MINDARPYASLSSGLLARKGSAKPAMRPQGFTGFEDLGWNDMGHEPGNDGPENELPEHVPSSIAALTPAPKAARADEPARGEEPEVVAQQRAIAESFASEAEAEADAESDAEPEAAEQEAPLRHAPAEIVALPKRPIAAPVAEGRKSAFTLRLDAGRHLRLRLATAVTGHSAQQIVTGALDALLESIPELEALAERVPPAKAKRN